MQGMIFGMLAEDWEIVQQDYYNSIDSRRTGRRWASLLVGRLWAVGFGMWEHRNACLHSDNSWKNRQIARRVDKRIRQEFESGHRTLSNTGRALFRVPLEKRLKTPLASKRRWLEMAGQEREIARKKARTLRLQRRNFEQFFFRQSDG